MIISKRFCSNCAVGSGYDGRKPKTQEVLIPSPITSKCCQDGFFHKCQVCGFKKRMQLTMAEWKKLTNSQKQQLCDHAFKLINSKKIDTIRDGLLQIQHVGYYDPDLIKPAIPKLLSFLKPDFITGEELREYSEWGNEEPSVTDEGIGGIVTNPKTGKKTKITIKVTMPRYGDPPSVIIRKDAIRTIGMVGEKKPELFSDAIPLIEKLLLPSQDYDWLVDHAIHTLRVLKAPEEILKKYEKIHEQTVKEKLKRRKLNQYEKLDTKDDGDIEDGPST